MPFEDQNTQSLYQKILSANYQFTCYLSSEVRNLVENILVPEPALRYGLKQIKQNVWFKKYVPYQPIEKGNINGIVNTSVYKKLLNEMKEQCPSMDLNYTKCSIMANKKNNVTAHYYLLLKKKTILGESLSDFSQLGLLDDDADMQV